MKIEQVTETKVVTHYRCDECDYSTTVNNNMLYHLADHHSFSELREWQGDTFLHFVDEVHFKRYALAFESHAKFVTPGWYKLASWTEGSGLRHLDEVIEMKMRKRESLLQECDALHQEFGEKEIV
jgi:hypothetical protein